MTNELTHLRRDFLDDPGVSLLHLADTYGFDIAVVEEAATEGNWLDQKREHLKQKYETKNAEYREMASEKRLPMVVKQLDIVEQLQNRVLLALEEGDNSSHELRRMSETINSITSTLHNLLGIRDALTTEKKSEGGTNLFFLPNSAPIRRANSIST